MLSAAFDYKPPYATVLGPWIAPAYVGEGQPIDADAKRLKTLSEVSGAAALITAPGHVDSLRNAGCHVISTINRISERVTR